MAMFYKRLLVLDCRMRHVILCLFTFNNIFKSKKKIDSFGKLIALRRQPLGVLQSPQHLEFCDSTPIRIIFLVC